MASAAVPDLTMFDTTAFERLPPRREIEQYWAADNPTLWQKRLRTSVSFLALATLVVGLALNTLLLLGLRVFHADSLLPTSTSRFVVVFILFAGVALVVAPIVNLLPYRRLDYQLIGLFLLRRFARDNRMRVKLEWEASVASVRAAGNSVPGFPGTMFSPPGGRAVVVAPLLVSDTPRLRVGHVQYYHFSERARTQDWVFAEIPLPRSMPNIWLHSLRGEAAMPFSVAGGERVRLEGDFDEYFDTYAREGAQQEALYVLTPDVMALLIDNASRFDVEIVDDRLYLYTRGYFDVLIDPSWWQAVADVMNTVGQKVTRSASRYTAGGSAGEQARRIQTRATVWRRITQTAGLLVLLGGPAVLFVAAAQTHA
ncbi:hypothetical protein B7R54_08605 [Subtercola boreus]|uniref:DUF3137 domain-containing protein n=1 Tax=Subtercola boreus TaxID=120213 RepID=A0A3E0VHT7_9MICO|nr:hypothetical protein [Subtercola boreus]RFA09281.1 hypothetical protein B7R54_08605 [Subtercola boreus]TQL53690.1 hypothetical protein FB464_1206 [Subtercola boreus]